MDNTGKKASLTDTVEGTCLTFPQFGDGKFLIGLSLEDKLTMVNWNDREKDRNVVVPLFSVEQNGDKGYLISPVNKDLPCSVNKVKVAGVAKLPKDCKLEIGDKSLKFNDGSRKPRQLPPTPGVMVLPSAPRKPTRVNGSSEKLDGETNKEIASVAASHVVRQMMLYTDLKMSVTMMDELYRAFQDVVATNKSLLLDFLQESKREIDLQKRAQLSNEVISQPLHGPVIKLLVDLLKHSLDPISHVILWLQFLRTLSHFTHNFTKMVSCQAAAAIMGSMAAFLEVPEIQQYGLEVLAKLATYRPLLNEKAPVRETGVEMIVRAIKYHDGSLNILRPACRALANLAFTALDLTSQRPNSVTEIDNPESEEAKQRFTNIVSYIRETGLPAVRDVMSVYPRDLGIQTESRRLITILAPESKARQRVHSEESCLDEDEELGFEDEDRRSKGQEESKSGILKSARSFENLRSADRRVQFTQDTFGGSISAESDFLDSWESSSSRRGFLDSCESPSSPTDSVSGRFLDSFGNEMDVAEPASYIGSDAPSCSTVVNSNGDSSRQETADKHESYREVTEEDFEPKTVPSLPRYFTEEKYPVLNSKSDSDIKTKSSVPIKTKSSIPIKTKSSIPIKTKSSIPKASVRRIAHMAVPGENSPIKSADAPDSVVQTGDVSGQFESILTAVDGQAETELEDSLLSTIDEGSIECSQDVGSAPVKTNLPKETPVPEKRKSKMVAEVETVPAVPPRCPTNEATEAQIIVERTAVDAQFLTKLLRTVITRHVCSMVLSGEDSEALQAIDQPMASLLSCANAHDFLKTHVASEYQAQKSLMDIDPSMVISIIDAVRYKSLTCDLMKSSLTELIGQINDGLDHEVSGCAIATIYLAIADDNLETIFAEKKFIRQMLKSFPNLADGFLKDKMEELQQTLTDLL